MEKKELSEGHPIVIGIDLGTTNSCVAVWEYDHVEIILNDEGNRTTPSYVSFTDKEKLVGDVAQRNAYMDPINTFYAVKRFIGCRFSDPLVQKDINLFPFTVVSSENERLKFVARHGGEQKQFSAEEISSMILMKMKQIAEKYLRCTVKDAVITVPAYFSDSQRRATKNAGIIAGLNVKRIMDEPTAAALAYGFHKINDHSKPHNVFVFDLGGGTFDASMVKICGGNFEVKATAGDTHLGGEDFDNRMLIYFVEEFKRTHNKDITTNPRAIRRLKGACERAKRTLSTAIETTVQVDYLLPDQDFCAELSQNKFNELNKDLFEKCITLTDQCLKDAKVDKSDVDLVVLAGGSSRIPIVQQLLQEYFGDKILHTGINEDEAVAYGAAIQAAKLSDMGGDILDTIVLTDVTPLSLGVKVLGDVMCPIIPRNTPVPTKKMKNFTTFKDDQTTIGILVYEGERVQASSNNLLGTFEVSGISPSPRGVPTIDVCFEIDADGILNVSATARDNGQVSKITITNEESWLRKEEIDKMITDAEKSKTEDEEHQRKFHAWNKLDKYIINMRRTMRKQELISLISESERKKMEDEISEVISWLDKNRDPLASVEASQYKLHELQEMCEPIIAKME